MRCLLARGTQVRHIGIKLIRRAWARARTSAPMGRREPPRGYRPRHGVQMPVEHSLRLRLSHFGQPKHRKLVVSQRRSLSVSTAHVATTPLAQEAENTHLEALAAANQMIEQQMIELVDLQDAQSSSDAHLARIQELEQKVSLGTH